VVTAPGAITSVGGKNEAALLLMRERITGIGVDDVVKETEATLESTKKLREQYGELVILFDRRDKLREQLDTISFRSTLEGR
jgi:hypothetical protein